jgi:acetolactate synthase I/III small subunit
MQRQSIVELARLFHARVVDVGMDSMILELCAKSSRVEAFVELMRPYGILEAARSGIWD